MLVQPESDLERFFLHQLKVVFVDQVVRWNEPKGLSPWIGYEHREYEYEVAGERIIHGSFGVPVLLDEPKSTLPGARTLEGVVLDIVIDRSLEYVQYHAVVQAIGATKEPIKLLVGDLELSIQPKEHSKRYIWQRKTFGPMTTGKPALYRKAEPTPQNLIEAWNREYKQILDKTFPDQETFDEARRLWENTELKREWLFNINQHYDHCIAALSHPMHPARDLYDAIFPRIKNARKWLLLSLQSKVKIRDFLTCHFNNENERFQNAASRERTTAQFDLMLTAAEMQHVSENDLWAEIASIENFMYKAETYAMASLLPSVNAKRLGGQNSSRAGTGVRPLVEEVCTKLMARGLPFPTKAQILAQLDQNGDAKVLWASEQIEYDSLTGTTTVEFTRIKRVLSQIKKEWGG
jgi:hypothetical protein